MDEGDQKVQNSSYKISKSWGCHVHINAYLSQGMDKKEALKTVAKERGVSKSSLYKYTVNK